MALQPAFVWGAGGKRMTPEEIERERRIVQALTGGVDTSPVGHWTQGAARVVDALGGVMRERRADSAEAQNSQASQSRIASMLASMGSGSSTPAAMPSATPTNAELMAPGNAMPAASSGSGALPASFLSVVDKTEGAGDYDTLFGHAQRGPFAGVSVSQMPISEVMAFADPSGPYAQHVKGQIGRVATPMGRHQIVGTTLRNAVAEMGLDPNTPFNSQTQDQIAAHLARRRLAGAGTLPEKMAALRSEWEGFRNVPDSQLAQIVTDLEAGPVMEQGDGGEMVQPPMSLSDEVADYQQTPGYQAQFPGREQQPLSDTAFETRFSGQEPAPMGDAMAPQPVDPLRTEVQQLGQQMGSQQLANADPRQGILQVLMGQGDATAFPPAPGQEQAQGGGLNPAIIEALSSPYASPAEKQIAATLMEQQMQQQAQASDPMRALELERAQLENEALRNPDPADIINAGDGRLYDPNSGQWITAPNSANADAPTVQTFYGEDGSEYKAQWNRETGDWEQVGGNKLPSGMSLRTNADGTVELVQGAGASQKLTEGQGKDIGFYTRGIDADAQLSQLDTALTDFGQQAAGSLPLGIGNYLRNPEFRQAKQAADSFLTAVLRKDTGAAITNQEFEIYGPMFLPVPGDDLVTIEQKRRARQVALLAIRSGLGTAEAIGEANRIALGLDEQQLPSSPTQRGSRSGESSGIPSGVDPRDWEFMTPEERALFQ